MARTPKPQPKKRPSMRDSVHNRAQTREKRGGGNYLDLPEGVESFVPEKKTYNLDIIPYEVSVEKNPEGIVKGLLWYQRTIWVHYDIGAQGLPFLCSAMMAGKSCPICDDRKRLAQEGDADDDTLKALMPKQRELFNVMDLDDQDKGIQLFEISFHNFGKLLEEECRADVNHNGFADLQGGFTLEVRFKETKLGKNTFIEAGKIDFAERDDYEESVLDDVLDLDTAFKMHSHEEVERAFLELGEGEEAPAEAGKASAEPEEAQRTPPRRRRRESQEEAAPPAEEPSGASRRTRSRKPSAAADESEPTCPHEGAFGDDYDKLVDCEKCKLWDACGDKAEATAKEK